MSNAMRLRFAKARSGGYSIFMAGSFPVGQRKAITKGRSAAEFNNCAGSR
jgi:hypothetical protein